MAYKEIGIRPTMKAWADLFGLSSAEARLARALTLGESLEDYARENDVCLPTVKTQLRSIFAKTGADRQAALVRLIIGIPAVRELSEGGSRNREVGASRI